MFKRKSFKILSLIMFFALCVPAIAHSYQDEPANIVDLTEVLESKNPEDNSEITELEVSEEDIEKTNTEETDIEEAEETDIEEAEETDIEEAEETDIEEAEETDVLEIVEDIIESQNASELQEDNAELQEVELQNEVVEETPVGGGATLAETGKENTAEPIKTKEELKIILSSVDSLPCEAVVEFTLDGARIGLVTDGLVIEASPILAAEKERVKAFVVNKVRIVGAKVNFTNYEAVIEDDFNDNMLEETTEDDTLLDDVEEVTN